MSLPFCGQGSERLGFVKYSNRAREDMKQSQYKSKVISRACWTIIKMLKNYTAFEKQKLGLVITTTTI